MTNDVSAIPASIQPSTAPGAPMDPSKRTWIIACGAAGAAGAAMVATPLLSSFQPSERAKAAGMPVEVSIADMKPGDMKIVEWRGKPVWIVRRTPEQLESLKKTEAQVADPQSLRNQKLNIPMEQARNPERALKPEFLVVVGICTHLGCSPNAKFNVGPQPSLPDDWQGGFLCPCHGSTFDMAGRVFKNKPAPDNLPVPPYTFLAENTILIGEMQKA